jgi:hypothetical protein
MKIFEKNKVSSLEISLSKLSLFMKFSIIFSYFHHILDRQVLSDYSKPRYFTFRWLRRVKLMNRARKSTWELHKVREMTFGWPKKWVKKCTHFQACTLNAKNEVLGAVKLFHERCQLTFFCIDSLVMTSYGPLSPRRDFQSHMGWEFASWDSPMEIWKFFKVIFYVINLKVSD